MRTPIFLLALLAPCVMSAAPRSSANYGVPADGMRAGGGGSSSAVYAQTTSIGGIVGTSEAGAPPTALQAGLVAQLAPSAPPAAPSPLAGSDDFNDNSMDTSKWEDIIQNGGASFVETNGRLEYRVSTPDTVEGFDEILRTWVLNTAGNNDAFEVVLDVTNIVNPSDSANASIGLTVTSLQNDHDSLYVELFRAGPGGDGKGFLSALRSSAYGGNEVLPHTLPTHHPAVTTGSVRVSYNPATMIFTTYYDTTGSADGFQWQAYGSFGVGPSGGGSMRNSPWQLHLNQGFEVSVSGFSEGLVVSSGQVHADNFHAATGLAGWRLVTFGSANAAGSAADDADPDKDGVVNLVEYATGQNPASSGTLSTPLSPPASGNIEFYYPRSIAAVAAGTGFVVEWSDTLASGTWSTVGVSQQVISDNGTLQQVKATLPAGTSGKRFVRLRVIAP